ncbi:MAG TPA: YggS family pyridoxal phosphate-dependent enzyme [Candidatus Limnocylindria bacterium]|nr:YggS family pyridoxal phosphate-dependent enzyme [Candidatus Limnocylindria bacterium]
MIQPGGDEISERYSALRARLDRIAEEAGREPDAYRIVAVTKTFPVAVVQAARRAGLTLFGENRVQEALPKIEACPEAEWHLIGHLQSNKARAALQAFAMIHSVDSLDLLRRLERVCHDDGRAPTLLLQVNVSGEGSKSGFDREWFDAQVRRPDGELATAIGQLRHARVDGLMTIAAADADPRPLFSALRRLRDQLEQSLGRPLPELSMGMSGDAEAAVAEGATLVRIGTALFGPRPPR